MKFGLLYELQMPKPWTERSEYNCFWEAMEQIILAEEVGFEYVWFVEHHFLTEFAHSCAPEVYLGALSQRTSKIRLGHGVVLLPINHPIRVAERIATLDILSNGRAEFGTGRSSSGYQLTPFGSNVVDARPAWDEALSMIPRMWSEEVFSYHSDRFQIEPREVWPKPIQKPHPPLWLACSQPDSFAMAASKGLGALCFTVGEPGELERRVQIYRDAIREADPVGGYVNEHIAAFSLGITLESDREARELGLPAATWYFANARDRLSKDWQDEVFIPENYRYNADRFFQEDQYREDADPNQLIENGTFCIGNPDNSIKTIEKYESVGVDQFMVCMQSGRIPHDKIMESIRLYGKHVIPHFKLKENGR